MGLSETIFGATYASFFRWRHLCFAGCLAILRSPLHLLTTSARAPCTAALRRLLDAADAGAEVDVRKVVEDMRASRNMMVQAQIQYEFVHYAVRDALEQKLQDLEEAQVDAELASAE